MDNLLSGQTNSENHNDSMSKFTGMQNNYAGSNLDNFMRVLDNSNFTSRQNLDEISKARSINYAHGLQIDDIGDDYDMDRNNYSDDMYKFFITAREMARKSNGTMNDLIQACASLLGCNYSDVYMVKDRDANKQTGDPKTVKVVNIPYNKVTNFFVLDHLAEELKRSAAEGTQIKFISFAIQTDMGINVDNYSSLCTHIHTDITGGGI